MASDSAPFKIQHLLTGNTSDSERHTHLNITKCFLLGNNYVKDVISAVNKSLSVNSTRDKGFELLNDLLDFTPTEVVICNAISWIKIAMGRHPKEDLRPLRLSVIAHVIDICCNSPEFKKIFVADYLVDTLEACLKTENSSLPEQALKCLIVCLVKYPSSCGPLKTQIEAALLKCLEYQGDDLVFLKNVGVAINYMNQIGGAGIEGINHQNNWTNQLDTLCSSFEQLFKSFVCESDVHPVSKRLRNHIIIIKVMLEKSYPVPKVIPLQQVLDLIAMVLGDHECICSSSVTKARYQSLLIQLQVDALYLLRSFIACTQQKLIPFALTINKTLMNYLKRIHTCDCFKGNCTYSLVAYKVITYWIKTVRNAFHSSFHERLINFIITDISPSEQKVTLQLTAPNKKKTGKTSIGESLNVPTLIPVDRIDTVRYKKFRLERCAHALHCLSEFLKYTFVDISDKLTMELYTVLSKTLIDVQNGKMTDQYADPKCQLFLYKALVSIFEQPYLSVPPPLQSTIRLLNIGQNSKENRIAATCREGLNKLESLCQPACPTLYVGHQAKSKELDKFIGSTRDGMVSTQDEKKICILSDIIIKPAVEEIDVDAKVEATEVAKEVEHSSHGPTSSDGEIEEVYEDVNLQDSRDDQKNNEEDDICVVEETDLQEGVLNLNGNVDDDDVEIVAVQYNGEKENGIAETIEPPAKRMKTDVEVESDESMLESFVNVIND